MPSIKSLHENIRIVDLVIDYFNKLKDRERIYYEDGGIFNIIQYEDDHLGIIGFLPTKKENEVFLQIVLEKKYRGKGIASIAIDKMAKQYNLHTVLATCDKNNKASKKALNRSGFYQIHHTILRTLLKRGLMRDTELRYKKTYNE